MFHIWQADKLWKVTA